MAVQKMEDRMLMLIEHQRFYIHEQDDDRDVDLMHTDCSKPYFQYHENFYFAKIDQDIRSQ